MMSEFEKNISGRIANLTIADSTMTNKVELPDLIPYKPKKWDGAIVISTQPETKTDAVEITTEDTIYIDWAALNQGSVNTVNTFHTRLFLDGSPIKNWYSNPPLKPNFYSSVRDFELDPLPAGNHTLTLEVDYQNEEPESNEENNVFEKEFTVVPVDLPDLVPYQPKNWDSPIVISTEAGTNSDATVITTEDSLYIDWAALNQGSVNTVNTIHFRLSLDGSPIKNWSGKPPLKPNSYNFARDFKIDALPAGNHTLTLEVDYRNKEPESNEENNIFEKEFTVVPAGTEFNINQFGDSTNPGSLRHAIIQANNSAEDDVINLAEGTYTLSLAGRDEKKARTGDLDIANNGTLTIQGDSNGAVIDAQGIDRVFDIFQGATLILNNITVINGKVVDKFDQGGGIRNKGSIKLNRVIIAENQAYDGGGISQGVLGELSLTDSVVEENTAKRFGGGLHLGGKTVIENSIIRKNQTTNSYSQGGGIRVGEYARGTTISDTVIDNNQSVQGGGIFNERRPILINTQIINNQAQDGGGVYHEKRTLTVIDSNIDNNQATNGNGGGIFHNGGLLEVVNSSITNNIATSGSGGGIHHTKGTLSRDPLLHLIGSTVAANQSDGHGAGIYFPITTSVHKIINSTIIRNIVDADGDGNGTGGGIAITKPTVSDWLDVILENTVIAYNQTGLGEENDVYGGVFNYSDYEGNNNNLIGNTDGAYGVTGMDGPFGENDLLNIDPLLGPLQDNGGNRLTAEPLPGSPLIDAGNNDNLPADTYDVDGDGDTDELLPLDGRGDDRIKGGTVDIGAVEGTETAALVRNLDLEGDEQALLAEDCLNIGGLGFSDLISNLMEQLVVNLTAYGLNGNGITGAVNGKVLKIIY